MVRIIYLLHERCCFHEHGYDLAVVVDELRYNATRCFLAEKPHSCASTSAASQLKNAINCNFSS